MASQFDTMFATPLERLFGVHAQDVEYRPGETAEWRTVRGIYDPSHERASTDSNVPVITQERILDLRTADIDFEPKTFGHQVRIGAEDFDVIEVRPQPMTWRLKLDRAFAF